MSQHSPRSLVPVRQFIRACRRNKKQLKFADSTGVEMNSGRALLASLVFRRLFRRILGPEERNVGLLMPTSVYGVLANLGLSLDCRTTVNLNYTFGIDTINYCIRHADIKHVVTSRRVLDRFPDLKIDAKLIVMEEIGANVSITDKLLGCIEAFLTPVSLLEWTLELGAIKPEDPITIFFTSGSTGTPKGAVITQLGIAENVRAFTEHIRLLDNDVLLGSLPLFHSFGYTTTFWLPATSGMKGIYHFNPLEPKKIGEMAKKYQCTAFPTTPTFLRGYLRRCPKEDFENLSSIVAGAEKLPLDLIDAWEEKFGHRPAEGYGTTELSPVVATNVPKSRRSDYKEWLREGSIGRPLTNLQVRIVKPETEATLPPDTPGMLQVKGPSVMKEYYKDPEKTDEVLKDGWYSTGDIASIDKDGFIWITGRLSRISKIGGEMVPHILIEAEIDKIIRPHVPKSETDAPDILVAVSAVPEERKGERLIILHCDIPLSPEEICKRLQQVGLPNLWIPSPHDFFRVQSLPLLGTGKLDLKAIKDIAAEVGGHPAPRQ